MISRGVAILNIFFVKWPHVGNIARRMCWQYGWKNVLPKRGMKEKKQETLLSWTIHSFQASLVSHINIITLTSCLVHLYAYIVCKRDENITTQLV